jgi:hypothetical protein
MKMTNSGPEFKTLFEVGKPATNAAPTTASRAAL